MGKGDDPLDRHARARTDGSEYDSTRRVLRGGWWCSELMREKWCDVGNIRFDSMKGDIPQAYV